MPQIKNVFVKGKMNQDLDERLLPKGEYREGQNIQVSNSEDDDVGAVENVLGNSLAYTTKISGVFGNNCIGSFADTANNRIFWFITNYSDESGGSITSMTRIPAGGKCSIVMKDGDNEPVIIVSGSFLNFNATREITGINIVDNYLFWTDNFNQPRYIDINKADPSHPDYVNGYYDCEEKISVATIAPYEGPLLNQSNLGDNNGSNANGSTLVRDADVKSDFMHDRFIRFAYRYKYDNGQYSIISPFTQSVFKPLNDGKLKHTRGQTNLTNANEGTDFSTGNNREPKVKISTLDVARKTTLDVMQNAYNKVKMRIPLPRKNEFTDGAKPTSYSNDFSLESVEILLKESDSTAIKIVDELKINNTALTFGCYYVAINSESVTVNGAENNVNSTTNKTVKIDPIGHALVNESGSHTGQTFNFDNLIGSINVGNRCLVVNQANQTQGLKVVKVVAVSGTEVTFDTANDFVLNDNDHMVFIKDLRIGNIVDNMSSSSLGTEEYLHITNITVSVGGNPTLTLNKGITISDGATLIFKKIYWREHVDYTYKSQKPYKVLPENQVLRVSDKIPVRAKAQEVVGNRLVYGNITQGYSLPLDTNNREGIDYTVQDQVKSESEFGVNHGIFQSNRTVYRHHNLKQRRTYKVGIVLSDKYGRKSPVILSTNTSSDLSDTFTTLADVQDKSALLRGNYSWSANQEAIGKALAVTFQDQYIVEASKSFDQGTNPNGWYSWRFVVKQTEQDYHNVYTNYTANSWSNIGKTNTNHDSLSLNQKINGKVDTTSGGRSWLTIHGENINKVPRDVTEKFDNERDGSLSGSDVELYPKVVAKDNGGTSIMGHVDQKPLKVLSIGTAVEQSLFTGEDMVLNLTNTNADLKAKRRIYPFVYQAESNPLVAELPNLQAEPINIQGLNPLVHDLENVALDRPFGTPSDPNIGEADQANPHQVAGVEFGRSGLMVLETKPVESNLDIFFETSTGGLVKDLNDIIAFAPSGGPSNITLSNNGQFPESNAPGTVIANVTATLTTAAIINVQILNVVDGNGNNHTNKFSTGNNSGTWELKNAEAIRFSNLSGKDTYTCTLKLTQTGGASVTGDVDVTVTNVAPSIANGSGSLPANASSNISAGQVTATNGVHVSSNQRALGLSPGTVREIALGNPGGGTVVSGLELDQPTAGQIRIKTSSTYNQSAVFGTATSKSFETQVTDNGGLSAYGVFTITTLSSQVIAGWPHATDPCNQMCSVSSTNLYAVKGSSALAPNAFNIYAGNIIYIDQGQTTRLFAGTTGKFVFDADNAEYNINNGVVQTGVQVCPTC